MKAIDGRESLKFVSRGSFNIPSPGSADDPTVSGATVLLTNPVTGGSFTFHLPAAHWGLTSKKKAYRYRDSALAEPDTVRSALIGTTVIRVAARRTGIAMNTPSQGALGVVVTSGSAEYCARFDYGSIVRDQPGRFAARDAPAPSACPPPPTTTTITSPPTTTTTTTTSSITTTTAAPTCAGTAPLCMGTCPPGHTCGGAPLSPCTCQ